MVVGNPGMGVSVIIIIVSSHGVGGEVLPQRMSQRPLH
jgi:hypothetical protein